MTKARDLAQVPNQSMGFKNRIINGALGIWQRGTSGFTTLGNYSADRWQVSANTSLSAVAQSTDVPSGFRNSISVSGTNYPQIFQKIEALNCVDLVGQTVAVSFWLKQTSGAGANSFVVYLATANAADNFSAVTTVSATTISATSSWVQYTATFTNLPANAANGIQVVFYANTTGAATFLLTGVQLEKGSTATSFDYRPYGTEELLCKRYYEVLIFRSNVYAASYASAPNRMYGIPVTWSVRKRATPSVENYTAFGYYTVPGTSGIGAQSTYTFTAFEVSETTVAMNNIHQSGGGAPSNAAVYRWEADMVIRGSAEL